MFLQKPFPWDVNERGIAPEWAWIWGHRHIFVPYWENAGAPFAFGPDDFGTFVNQADWQDTAVGPGIDCPGSDDYVTFTRNFFPDGEGTVFIVFIPDIVGATNQILCYESDGTSSDHNGFGGSGSIREIHLGLAGGLAEFTYQDGAAADDQLRIPEASSTLTAGVVNTMAATWKDGGTHFLYVNGIERASGASVAPYDLLTPTVVRWGAPGDLTANREFDGKILKHYSLTKQLPGSVITDLHRDFSGPFRMADEVVVLFPVAFGISDYRFRQRFFG